MKCEYDLERLNNMVSDGLMRHLALAVACGEMPEADAWEQQARHERARELSKLAGTKWPKLDVSWDDCPGNFYRSLDGVTAPDFRLAFPEIEVMSVDTEDLHVHLAEASERVKSPFAVEYKSKTADLVAHLERGGIVTPVFVRYVEGILCLAGGNHRFGWARHRGQRRIPILLLPQEKEAIASKLDSLLHWP